MRHGFWLAPAKVIATHLAKSLPDQWSEVGSLSCRGTLPTRGYPQIISLRAHIIEIHSKFTIVNTQIQVAYDQPKKMCLMDSGRHLQR